MGIEPRNFEIVTVDPETGGTVLLDSESHRLFTISNALRDQLTRDNPVWPEEAEAELESLRASGVLAPYNARALSKADPLAGANLALNINLTAFCNLGCTYCFAEGGDYGRLKGKLSKDVDVDAIVAFIEEKTRPGETVRFEFFGGEPLMNFPVIEELCARSLEMRARLGIEFIYRVSTNLTTKLTGRELSLFHRFRFIVSVSIDGGAKTHDRNRPRKSGRGSQEAIARNCEQVRAASEDITLVARMTYVPYPDSSLVEDMRHLYDMNIFDWFQILPAAVAEENHAAVYGDAAFDTADLEDRQAPYNAKIEAEFEALHDRYLDLFTPANRFKGILEVETVMRMILDGEFANGFCSGGRNYFTFSPDKSIMPCHRLVGDEGFQVGDFHAGVDDAKVAAWRTGVNAQPVCSRCSIRYICGGGCKQENTIATGDINAPDPAKCAFQFALVRSAVRIIARGGEALRARDRGRLSALFVSCGRPMMPNNRKHAGSPDTSFEHLRLLA
ncbi:radical SAM protein [Breoghania sp. L-A4]|uniref:radical SAM/SPASM domain-containing protein n=1 Tax=Breoghania sp. L-A4 TaxID=2304600 RepID=UPI000E35B423|nr:radical SAM protein [Breoghania sp. L-A4]AXS41688.1 SPASM domain-containing protein [Breoghania sp. L-A4]